MAEQMAKARGYWIPMMQVFSLGVPGPSGNENDIYVAEQASTVAPCSPFSVRFA